MGTFSSGAFRAVPAGMALCIASNVCAHNPDEPPVSIPEIPVEAGRPVAASSQQFIPDKEILLQPFGRPSQVLRLIPGFMAVEHSGGAGKADQYFLRGFDADHGTDVGFFLDGMPINLRSHAHGQGYTDLNFIIPETIEGVDVHKGSYMPEYGDFVTAGAVNFRTRERVKEGVLRAAGGEYGAHRYLLMDLFTDFTFFLNDPVNGDGFAQFDRRAVSGGDIGFTQLVELLGMPAVGTIGFQARADEIHAKLGTQTRRIPVDTTVDSDVLSVSYSPFVKAELQPLPWLRLSGGVRGEFFTFAVSNRCAICAELPSGRTSSGLVLPKLSMILGPWLRTEFFINYGEGFHSNDARSAVAIGASPLAKARSYEVGIRSRPWGSDGLELIATAWRLDLKSELVLVGDEGTTEIRGATGRQGVEVAARGQVWGPLSVHGSFTWTHAEFRNGGAIPLAPEYTAYGAAMLQWPDGLTSQLQATYMGVRPLAEDRTIRSPSWITFDLSERYTIPIALPLGRSEAFLFVQNLVDSDWEQAIFAFESRLRNEPLGVKDIHFVPGNPRTLMGGMAWDF